MTQMLHRPEDQDAFDLKLQLAQLRYVTTSHAAADVARRELRRPRDGVDTEVAIERLSLRCCRGDGHPVNQQVERILQLISVTEHEEVMLADRPA